MLKRVSIIICCFVFTFFFTNMQKGVSIAIPTMNIPVERKTVVIDAGHGEPDGGATTSDGISEADINLKIAFKVEELLKKGGMNVVMTRKDENSICDESANTINEKKNSDIKKRVEIANNSNADIYVSIHLNKIPQKNYWGWQTFYQSKSEYSKKLASCIQDALNISISNENKRVTLKLDNTYIMKNVEIPTTTVECGFLSNDNEKKKLITDDYQSKLAWGIYSGIMEYFR